MDALSDSVTFLVESAESTVSTILTINRWFVSTFYISIWYIGIFLFKIYEIISFFILTLVDFVNYALQYFYWCAENALITLSQMVLRLEFLSQIIPETFGAMLLSAYDVVSHILANFYHLLCNILFRVIYVIKLAFISLEYFGSELRRSVGDFCFGVMFVIAKCKDLWEIVRKISLLDIKSFINGLPCLVDCFLAIFVLFLAFFFLRKAITFVRQRGLTCWPIHFGAQLKRLACCLRMKLKRQPEEEEKNQNTVTCGDGNFEPHLAICDGSNMCIICVERPRDTLLLPCRHLCLCSTCWDVIDAESTEADRCCPLCRVRVSAFVTDVFIS